MSATDADMVAAFAEEGMDAEAHGEGIHSVVTVKRAGTSEEEIVALAEAHGFEWFATDHVEVTLTGHKDALRNEWRAA